MTVKGNVNQNSLSIIKNTVIFQTIVNAAQAADPADPVAATTAGTRQVFWLLLGVMVVAGLLAGAAVLPGAPAADPPVPAAPVQ